MGEGEVGEGEVGEGEVGAGGHPGVAPFTAARRELLLSLLRHMTPDHRHHATLESTALPFKRTQCPLNKTKQKKHE